MIYIVSSIGAITSHRFGAIAMSKAKSAKAGAGLLRYGYAIAEELILLIPSGRFEGGRGGKTGSISNEADAIFIEGNEVELF